MTLRSALLLALLAPTLVACDTTDEDLASITATVAADAQLSTLEAAVIEAGLATTLDGDGPFTVFAPTDDAFASALEALDLTAAELLGRDDLGAILQLHVLAGAFNASDFSVGQTVTTLNGQTLTVVSASGGLGLDTEDEGSAANAVILATDIEASNGVVHTIGSVLLPASN
ncbi:fasciclin domain-containing protein [Rubrivirga sp. IMCC43871]|uniref:fasciclin domain-containing protein n=1 Tax=Rubrivirga sp. IMCC43871 TaxID=3391575 RepID=UPI0039901075